MDALSEVFRALRLTSGIFLEAEFTAPWCIDSAPGRDDVSHIMPSADHVAIYHVVTEGSCRAKLPNAPGIADIGAGDVIMFPQGDGHLLGSDLRLAPVSAERIVTRSVDGGVFRIEYGGGGARTRFVCGFLACDARLCRPLLGALPRMLHLPLTNHPAAGWIAETLRRGAAETRAPRTGTDAVLAKLAELLFIEAIRVYIDSLSDREQGWFAALRDTKVGRALAIMHADPARGWTVEELGRAVGLSRSALAERFAQFLGEPPMQYLTRWRLALAARELREGRDTILQVAEQVGYDSEAAFNRAFKREFGMPPASWRRQCQAAPYAQSSAA